MKPQKSPEVHFSACCLLHFSARFIFSDCCVIDWPLFQRWTWCHKYVGGKLHEAFARKLSGHDAQTSVRACLPFHKPCAWPVIIQHTCRGDELVEPIAEPPETQVLKVSEGDARTNAGTVGSAVASGAPGDAKRRALSSEAETVDSIRQPASLQVVDNARTILQHRNQLFSLYEYFCPSSVTRSLFLFICGLTIFTASWTNRRFQCRRWWPNSAATRLCSSQWAASDAAELPTCGQWQKGIVKCIFLSGVCKRRCVHMFTPCGSCCRSPACFVSTKSMQWPIFYSWMR